MRLEPKAQAFVAMLAAANGPPLYAGTPDDARAQARMLAAPGAPRALARVEDRSVPTGAGSLPVRLYADARRPRACIAYLHGGGWVLGGIDESDMFARELAAATDCMVVSVGYRLAPEHPFPAALDDSYAALEWVAANCTALIGRSAPLVVMGDSAGGNLATVVTRRALERRGPSIALQILAYPVTDAAMDTASYREFADGPLLTRELMSWFWQHYIAAPHARLDPEASPLRLPSLAGLPPTFVLTAANDPLRDEGEAYARRLAADGVETRLQRYAGQIHAFLTLVGMFDGGALALNDIAQFIRERVSA